MHNPTDFSLSYILIERCKGMSQNLIIIHTLKRKSKIGINTQFNELNYMTGSSRQKSHTFRISLSLLYNGSLGASISGSVTL